MNTLKIDRNRLYYLTRCREITSFRVYISCFIHHRHAVIIADNITVDSLLAYIYHPLIDRARSFGRFIFVYIHTYLYVRTRTRTRLSCLRTYQLIINVPRHTIRAISRLMIPSRLYNL